MPPRASKTELIAFSRTHATDLKKFCDKMAEDLNIFMKVLADEDKNFIG